ELKGPIFCLTHRHSTSAPPLIASKPTSVNDSARSYHTSSTPGKWKSGLKARRRVHVREKSEVIRLVQEAIDLRKDTLHSHPPRAEKPDQKRQEWAKASGNL